MISPSKGEKIRWEQTHDAASTKIPKGFKLKWKTTIPAFFTGSKIRQVI